MLLMDVGGGWRPLDTSPTGMMPSNAGARRRDRALSDALLDEVACGGRRETGAEAEQGIESRGGVPATVPSEDELVEVAPEVLATEAMEGPERPSFEVREDTVGPAQDDVGGHLADHFRLVHMVGQASVAGPPVCDDAGAGCGDGGDEGLERGGGEVGDRRETDATRLALGRELHRAGNEHLALGAAALPASGRIVLTAQGDLGLVDLDDALEKASPGIDHGAAELRQEQPGALVAAQAQLGLQLQGGDPVGVAGDDVDGREPGLQR